MLPEIKLGAWAFGASCLDTVISCTAQYAVRCILLAHPVWHATQLPVCSAHHAAMALVFVHGVCDHNVATGLTSTALRAAVLYTIYYVATCIWQREEGVLPRQHGLSRMDQIRSLGWPQGTWRTMRADCCPAADDVVDSG